MSMRIRHLALALSVSGGFIGGYIGTLAHGVSFVEGLVGGTAIGAFTGLLVAVACWSIPFRDMGRQQPMVW